MVLLPVPDCSMQSLWLNPAGTPTPWGGTNGKAVGIVQIHKVVVTEVNRFNFDHYVFADRLNQQKSYEIWDKYLIHWGNDYERLTHKPVTDEVYSRIWNGGPRGWQKPETIKYWDKVKVNLP